SPNSLVEVECWAENPTSFTSVASSTPWKRATSACTSRIRSRTSSAEPPGSAWMKLACLGDTIALPCRRPLRPAESISRPAESPAGWGHPGPAVSPPGRVLPPPFHALPDDLATLVGIARYQPEPGLGHHPPGRDRRLAVPVLEVADAELFGPPARKAQVHAPA